MTDVTDMLDDPPGKWERLEHLCYPNRGSKGFKHPSGANVHIVNMYDSGYYIAQKEDEHGGFEEMRYIPYREAACVVVLWMKSYD